MPTLINLGHPACLPNRALHPYPLRKAYVFPVDRPASDKCCNRNGGKRCWKTDVLLPQSELKRGLNTQWYKTPDLKSPEVDPSTLFLFVAHVRPLIE